MDLEKAIKKCTAIVTTKFNNDYSIDSVDKEAIETVLQTLGNSVPKKKIEIVKEELEKMKKRYMNCINSVQYAIDILQELLRDK